MMERNDILEGWTTARANAQKWQAEQDRLFQALIETTAPAPVRKAPVIDLVDPPALVALPGEKHLAEFYGKPWEDETILDWFNWPVDDAVLYTREGADLIDRTGDGLDDHRTHKNLVEALQDALAMIYATLGSDRFHGEGWHVYGGSFNYRSKKLGKSLSVHAYGAAVDFNPHENPLFSDTSTFSDESVAIMESFGFLWGPRAWGMPGYENPKHPGRYVDAMHFQAAIPYVIEGSWYHKNGWPKNVRLWNPTS